MIAERVDNDAKSATRFYDRAFAPILDESDSTESQARILTYIGVLAEEAHRLNDAESLYLQALRADPIRPEALQNLAILRIGQSRRNEALILLQKAHEVAPDDAEISANLQRLKDEMEKLSR